MGNKFYVTSLNGDRTQVFSDESLGREGKENSQRFLRTTRPSRSFLERTNYYGQIVEMDGQGRILIPSVFAGVGGDEGGKWMYRGTSLFLEIWKSQPVPGTV